ncbi:unnamed protein product [Allacma fusca]|uniref:Uncharacterized protein n=1 Tax=Allacma fusca TaxID=39272 RepID=A0A8J2JF16_9HEXA|nr:unnamed protein product [Allacma fusca]
MGPCISTLWKKQPLSDLKRGEKRKIVEGNQESSVPSSGDNGPGRNKARKKIADADSESSSDSNASCNIEPAPKSPREEGTTESKDIEGVKDLKAPGEPGLEEAEKEEMNKALLGVQHLQKYIPENTRICHVAKNVTMDGHNVGVIDTPESSEAMNVYNVAKNVELKGGTSMSVVLTGNGHGKAAHTIAENYTTKPGATDIGSVGSKDAANFALDMLAGIRNLTANSQGPAQTQSTNFPAAAPRSSNPCSKSPAKKHRSNVRTFRDYEDTPDGETLGGNTVAEDCSSHAITEQVREKRLNSPYIQNLVKNN